MYIVELDNGTIITGATMPWADLLEYVKKEGRSIVKAGLTDTLHFADMIAGADGYYYFALAEAIMHSGTPTGGIVAVMDIPPPKVIAEEIAGFYTVDTAMAFYDNQLHQVDDQIAGVEEELRRLRSTSGDQTYWDAINVGISQKQGIADGLAKQRGRLLKERAGVKAAGGFIVSRRLETRQAKFPVNIDPAIYRELSSDILDQNPAFWIGAAPTTP